MKVIPNIKCVKTKTVFQHNSWMKLRIKCIVYRKQCIMETYHTPKLYSEQMTMALNIFTNKERWKLKKFNSIPILNQGEGINKGDKVYGKITIQGRIKSHCWIFWSDKLVKPIRSLQEKVRKQKEKNMERKGTMIHRAIGKILQVNSREGFSSDFEKVDKNDPSLKNYKLPNYPKEKETTK